MIERHNAAVSERDVVSKAREEREGERGEVMAAQRRQVVNESTFHLSLTPPDKPRRLLSVKKNPP